MLILTRKPGERIYIGPGITLTVVEVNGNRVRLGIDAPEDVPILRAELGDFLAEPPISNLAGSRRRTYEVAGLCAKG
jgi:carbon storage regulator